MGTALRTPLTDAADRKAIMNEAQGYRARETLREGTQITIRAVRPDDRDRIVQAFAGLERESIYTRFFTHRNTLTDAELAHLDTMDFVNEVMLVATIERDAAEIVIGSARYVSEPSQNGRAAEIAFTVEEDYQGRGIAGLLLRHLIAIARQSGVARFEADVLASNKSMRAVFARCGLPMRETSEAGVVHVSLALTP
jgi:RimJ/RimL family protein N-acetyltransferase